MALLTLKFDSVVDSPDNLVSREQASGSRIARSPAGCLETEEATWH